METILSVRSRRFNRLAADPPLDVLVVGGGITGAPIYHQLCARGYQVAIVDKGDFACGTSQASGMMVWGGLLYLKNLDFLTVLKLCRARHELLRRHADEVAVLDLEYLVANTNGRRPATVMAALYLYWLLGKCALQCPTVAKPAGGRAGLTLGYQEGMLRESDSRFVMGRIRGFQSDHCIPLNYCRLVAAEFDPQHRYWRVGLRDELTGTIYQSRVKVLINGAGVWTDEVNHLLKVNSPYKHVFSKGVYIALPASERQARAAIYPMPGADDVLTHVPWGPVMLWGPTETTVHDLRAGLTPTREDLCFLLESASQALGTPCGPQDVISVRCGVRALAVPRHESRDVYPLERSRRHYLVANHERRAILLYGGKLTSSLQVAKQVAKVVGGWLTPRLPQPVPVVAAPEWVHHAPLRHDFVSPQWARDHEYCVTLDDYLRRRTSIAQWTPRMGLGRDDCQLASLTKMAEAFTAGPAAAAAMANAYAQHVRDCYDPLLSQ